LPRAGIGSWGELAELLPVDEAGLMRTLVSLQERRVIIAEPVAPEPQIETGRRGIGQLSEVDLCALLDPDRPEA
jgi:hypothetical protein